MKKNVIIVLLAAGAILLAGCQKGLFDRDKSSVRFTAVSSEVGTKTAYSGDVTTQGNKKYERIDWKANDVIRIWSDNAVHRYTHQHWSDYIVTADGTPHGRYSSASLAEANMNNVPGDGTGNGLVWLKHGDYQFFALYPAPASESVDGSEGVLPCSIPKVQTQSFTAGVAAPNMKLAFMTAAAKVTTEVDEEGVDVGLEFEPAFSAFEISIRSAGDAIGLTSFEMKSASKPLTGDFSVKYTAGTDGYNKEIVAPTTGDGIYVSLTGQEAPAASQGKDLTFTVFAIPKDYDDLSISFTTSGGITRTLQLKYSATAEGHTGEGITFAAGLKHRLYGLVLPNGELLISVDTAPWEEGSEHKYTTIEDASILFESVKAYKNGQALWEDTRIAIAPGYETVPVDPEDPTAGTVTVPKYSPMFQLTTISLPTSLALVSDNDKVGFVIYDEANRTYSDPVATVVIPKSTTTGSTYGDPVITTFFVVPLDGAATDGTTRAGISLIRTDCKVPVAYTHQDLPGSSDHTQILFQVVSESVYTNDTDIEIITPTI